MTTATRTHRTAGPSAEQRRARQDELLAALADGVLELTTSRGWRRYLRAMATLRTYSTGNSRISQPRECLQSVCPKGVLFVLLVLLTAVQDQIRAAPRLPLGGRMPCRARTSSNHRDVLEHMFATGTTLGVAGIDSSDLRKGVSSERPQHSVVRSVDARATVR